MRVEAIYIAPVKSLGLQRPDRVRITEAGIAEDRRFFVVDARGRLLTQRECGALVQVSASYDAAGDRLTLRFPSGEVVDGTVDAGERVSVSFFGERAVEGSEVRGPFAAALSAFAGQTLRLVKVAPGAAFDGYPDLDLLDGVGRSAAARRRRRGPRRAAIPAKPVHLRCRGARRGRMDRRGRANWPAGAARRAARLALRDDDAQPADGRAGP